MKATSGLFWIKQEIILVLCVADILNNYHPQEEVYKKKSRKSRNKLNKYRNAALLNSKMLGVSYYQKCCSVGINSGNDCYTMGMWSNLKNRACESVQPLKRKLMMLCLNQLLMLLSIFSSVLKWFKIFLLNQKTISLLQQRGQRCLIYVLLFLLFTQLSITKFLL